jgi:UDP-GlcNAc3NAcA epimerase
MKITSIIGARPQFIKHAPMSVELRKRDHKDIIIHTGQHYDFNMSGSFFKDLNLPKPDYNIGVGSGSHGYQTAEIIKHTEDILMEDRPDIVLVYGDTNSTMAGAIAATKLHIPVGHVEAGLRSFDRSMPEEINRIVTDHISDMLFCPTVNAFNNLVGEGIGYDNLYLTGDIMVDTYNMFNKNAEKNKDFIDSFTHGREYYVATIHRASNTDNMENLKDIIESFEESGKTIIFPVHPRTKSVLFKSGAYHIGSNIIYSEPLGYLEMLCLMKHAKKILTDSGGMQKEAYIMNVPCITLRENTEWIETLHDYHNILVGTDMIKILNAIYSTYQFDYPYNTPFGEGDTAKKIVDILEDR